MDLVVDDEAPVAGIEELEGAVFALGLAGDHLIGGDGDGLDFLLFAGVFADFVFGQGGAAQELVAPLAAGDGIGNQDERGGFRLGHRSRADDGFASAAREYDDAGAAGPEGLGGVLLVVTQLPAVVIEGDGVGLAIDVAGEILGRPASLEEGLFKAAALGGRDGDGVLVDARAEEFSGSAAGKFFQDGWLIGLEDETMGWVRVEADAAVAGHGFGDVDKQGLGDWKAGVVFQDVDDLLSVVSGRAGIPQRKWGDAVGVHVLGGALQLRKRSERGAGLGGLCVIHLEQDGLIRLHNQWSIHGSSVTEVIRCKGNRMVEPSAARASICPPATVSGVTVRFFSLPFLSA